MKNNTLIIAFLCCFSVSVFAAEETESEKAPYVWPWNQGLTWHIGADAVSSYLLRGWNYGGMAIEPHGSINYAGAQIAVWANIGAHDWSFQQFSPQLNVMISYNIAGLSIGITHLHYFNSKYFDFRGKTYEEYVNNTGNWNQTELFAVYNGPEKFPIRLSWYTYVGGNDKFPDYDNPIILTPPAPGNEPPEGGLVQYEMKRAFSTYIELAYKFSLPAGFYITPAIGISPWKGYYTRNEGKFALKNLEIRVERPFNMFKHVGFNLWAVGMLDCYKIRTDNFITTIDNTYSNQRLNLAVGAGINFY